MKRYGRPSANALKLAEKLRDGFERCGFGRLDISATEFDFVSGGWKKLDVYRWEVWAELTRPDGYIGRVTIGSYDTLADCVKSGGVDISADETHSYRHKSICTGSSFEAHKRVANQQPAGLE